MKRSILFIFTLFAAILLPTQQAFALTWPAASGSAYAHYNGNSTHPISKAVPLGDVNGDGFDDVGIKMSSSVVIVYGSSSHVSGGTYTTATNTVKISCSSGDACTGNAFGSSIAGVGDVNGDGFDDFLIGDTGYDYTPSVAAPIDYAAGAAYLYYGSATLVGGNIGTNTTDRFVQFAGTPGAPAGGPYLKEVGGTVASAGDMNNDGYTDFIIGAPGERESTTYPNTAEGVVYLFYGAADSPSATDPDGDVDTANNNDERNYGADNNRIVLLNGADSTEVRIIGDTYSSGGTYGARLGDIIQSAGDVDTDGCDDVVLSAPNFGASGNGLVYVIYGGSNAAAVCSGTAAEKKITSSDKTIANLVSSTHLRKLSGTATYPQTGATLAGGASINNDVYSDFAVDGWLIYGSGTRFTNNSTIDSINGTLVGTASGIPSDGGSKSIIESIGSDINGDGLADVLLKKSSRSSTTTTDSHRVLYGRSSWSGVTADTSAITFESTPGNYLSNESSGKIIGDMNNDGFSDIAFVQDISYGSASILYSEKNTPSLTGSNPLTTECAVAYAEPGATATDSYTNIASSASASSVNTANTGSQTVTYTFGNFLERSATANRTVTVVDTTAPTLSLTGSANITLTVGDAYSEAGAVATDGCDASISPTITGSVNTAVAGTYVLTYTATDDANNQSSTTRTITVNPTSTAAPSTSEPNTQTNTDSFTSEERAAIDPDSEQSYESLVDSVQANSNGSVTVSYSTGESSTYTPSSGDTNGAPVVIQVPKTGTLAVLSPKGKYLVLLNPYTGAKIATKQLSTTVWKERTLIVKDVRKDGSYDAIITLNNKKKTNNGRLIVVKIKKDGSGFSKKVSVKFTGKKLQTKRTRLSAKDTIEIRNTAGKRLLRYTLTKTYTLKLK